MRVKALLYEAAALGCYIDPELTKRVEFALRWSEYGSVIPYMVTHQHPVVKELGHELVRELVEWAVAIDGEELN